MSECDSPFRVIAHSLTLILETATATHSQRTEVAHARDLLESNLTLMDEGDRKVTGERGKTERGKGKRKGRMDRWKVGKRESCFIRAGGCELGLGLVFPNRTQPDKAPALWLEMGGEWKWARDGEGRG